MTEEWAGHRVGEPGFGRAAVAVFLAGIAVFATLYAPQALLPELARSFGVSPASSTLVISVSTGALAVGLLVLGPVSDRRGRTGILQASLASAAVLAVLIALAPAWGVLLVLRGLQGFALAGLPAVAVAYLREELHPGGQLAGDRPVRQRHRDRRADRPAAQRLPHRAGRLADGAGRCRGPGGRLRGRRPAAAAALAALRPGDPRRVAAAAARRGVHRPRHCWRCTASRRC